MRDAGSEKSSNDGAYCDPETNDRLRELATAHFIALDFHFGSRNAVRSPRHRGRRRHGAPRPSPPLWPPGVRALTPRKALLTFEKASSMGFRSGE
jgi:hypothetical protein